MKNILIIGNGFDLAHGLNTSYKDFVNFCECIKIFLDRYRNNKEDYITLFNHNFDAVRSIMTNMDLQKSTSRKFIIYLKNKSIDDKLKLDFITQCCDNYWLKYVYENKQQMGNRWCDLEYLIGLQVEALSFIANNPDKLYEENLIYHRNSMNIYKVNEELDKIKDLSFRESILKQRDIMFQDLKQLTWMLEVYLLYFLNDKRTRLELFNLLSVDYLLSFNYTNTYQRMYKEPEDKHYIHGNTDINRNKDENNMVFGIGQEIKNANDEDALDYVMFQKYYQRIVKRSGNTYKQWLNNKKEQLNVFIYGHSLDGPDGDIIRDFVEHPLSKIYIFYLDDTSFNNIVINLIDIFDKDKVVDLTSSDKISFIKCNDINTIKEII